MIIRVRVVPHAPKMRIGGMHNGALKVHITAAPERGKANKALCEYLARIGGVKPYEISIVRGMKSREKEIMIPDEAWERIQQGNTFCE